MNHPAELKEGKKTKLGLWAYLRLLPMLYYVLNYMIIQLDKPAHKGYFGLAGQYYGSKSTCPLV